MLNFFSKISVEGWLKGCSTYCSMLPLNTSENKPVTNQFGRVIVWIKFSASLTGINTRQVGCDVQPGVVSKMIVVV